MALFLITNNLTPADVLDGKRELAFPESVVDLIAGPHGPAARRFSGQDPRSASCAAKSRSAAGPGPACPPADFKQAAGELEAKLGRKPQARKCFPTLMFPKVITEFVAHQQKFSDTSMLPTPLFFYGQLPGQEVAVEIEQGKTLIIKFLAVGDPHPDGRRTVFFELNGQPRNINVKDLSLESTAVSAAPRPSASTRRRSARRCPAWSSPWRPAWAMPWRRAKSCLRWKP